MLYRPRFSISKEQSYFFRYRPFLNNSHLSISSCRLVGLVVGFFYHIYTHDKEGSIGISLRSAIQSTGIQGTLDDKLFATIVVTGFMQLSGMLMLPEFYGPSFNLLLLPKRIFTSLTSTSSKNYRPGLVKEQSVVYREPKENAAAPGGKRKRKKKKKN